LDSLSIQEPITGSLDEARFRFASSVGINPWTPGEMSLLKKTTLQEAFVGDSRVFNTVIAGVEYLILVKYSSTEAIRVLRIRVSDGAETTIVDNTALTENIIAVLLMQSAQHYTKTMQLIQPMQKLQRLPMLRTVLF
jgi:hypothetical protein